ncbi:class I SAM-dependent methyltransferase [Haloarcula nitratireducens]|uniref:Methyltransferase domain-containing protein n=1 Tax=Haloarcula nitratireducens TaxID=2487749 RepID=A0AAW4PBE7_9EURY|nr:methyltransferase domain-containing protein [Halomicroarcula nitratireducens]MBX0295072.1 methyltransferase domain-containing protein [Halomicroarcula nitratireducens]
MASGNGGAETASVPQTVEAALADRPIEGRVCLEAGAGVGNTTAGLLAAGAERVYAVTDDADHARTVRERCGAAADRLVVVKADLRETPLRSDAVDLVTAHGLCNVLAPAALDSIAAALTRVASPGAQLVVDDYAPLPDDAAVRALFAVENAATELADGRPALSFYPARFLRRLFAGHGWSFDRQKTLLDPVPWTASHLSAHAAAVRDAAARLPPELGDPLVERADELEATIGSESVGRMYSVAMTLSGDPDPA